MLPATGPLSAHQNQPKVTIAIPTHNRLGYLQRSVASALAQTYGPTEIVVSDNASTDGTREFLERVRDPRLVSIRQSTKISMIDNWDRCLEFANGEFFLLLSDDDYIEPTAIEKLVAPFMQTDEEIPSYQIGFSYCRIKTVDSIGRVIGLSTLTPSLERWEDLILQFFRRKRQLHPCAVLLRTKGLRRIGGYSGSHCLLAADAYSWMKVAIQYEHAAYVPEVLSTYTLHSASATEKSGVEAWITDIEKLVELSVTELNRQSKPALAEVLSRAGNQYLRKFITALLVHYGRKRHSLEFLAQFYRVRKHFSWPAGFLFLLHGLGRLMVPKSFEAVLKRVQLSSSEILDGRP
ncbi:MAG: glycosyl transferase family 2 [Acidobacteriales bacterium]|nr:glycosyl transferase family 2 [Terriglobales bacterium]